MKKHFIIVLSVCLLTAISGVLWSRPESAAAAPQQAPVVHTYTADNGTAFANPERGYHNRYEIIDDVSVNDYASAATSIAGFNPDMLDRTFSRAKADGDTIIHSYIHLDKYKNTDVLPQALLDNLSSGLAAIRAAGLKIILRPAYAWSESTAVPESRILGHIAQINAVISANSDVVLHLEAGYLGAWGEWHDSQYTDPFNRDQADNRYRVVKQILSTSPASIPVVIRYPIFIKEMMEMPAPAGTTPFTQAEKDRIGFHDDCFLSDSADMGTYDNNSWMGWFYIEEKKQWMYDLATSFGANKMVGGETCDASGSDDAAGVNVQTEMSKLHFTEINEDYAAVNTNIWKNANLSASGNDPAETAFVRLKRKMGYRLRLIDATFPDTATAGSTFTFSANLQNDGYAGMIKPRPLYLVFQSGSSRVNLPLSDVDVRQWLSGANAISVHNVTLPSSMPSGTYRVALWLPDSAAGLQARPEYSVRIANQSTWDSTYGFNVLSGSVTVGGGCTSCPTATPSNTPTTGPTSTATRTPTATSTTAPTATATTGPTQDPSSYEAESASNTLAGGAAAAACSGCSNGQKVGYVGNNAGTLQFNGVQAASAGSYPLTIYFASGEARSAQMSVNGGSPRTISFPSSGDWNTVALVQTTVTLNGGANTIKFSNSSGWAPDFDRVKLGSGSGGPTNTPTQTNTPGPTATKTNTPLPTNTPVGPTNTPAPTATKTNTPVPTNTTAPTNTPLPTATATSGGALVIDSFGDAAKWGTNHLNDLNQAISCATMDSCYYGDANPGNIVMNSSPAGQYYQEGVNRSLSGTSVLVLRLKDWWDSDTENHWTVVLNDGTDHSVALNSYGNVTASWQDISIPLSAFGANLNSVVYIRLVHKDATYAVLLIDAISAQ